MKKAHVIIIITVICLGYYILSLSSLGLALAQAGYSFNHYTILENDYDNNGNEFRIILANKDNKEALMHLVKNNMGFWKVLYTGGIASPQTPLISIRWEKASGYKQHLPSDNPDFSYEAHILYYGNNAVKLINISPSQLPDGIALNIQQYGSSYIIHLVSYEKSRDIYKIGMHQLLLDSKYIEVDIE